MGEVAASTSAGTVQRPCQRKTQKMKIKKEEEKREKKPRRRKKEREKKKTQKDNPEAMSSVGLQSATSIKSVKGFKQKKINNK